MATLRDLMMPSGSNKFLAGDDPMQPGRGAPFTDVAQQGGDMAMPIGGMSQPPRPPMANEYWNPTTGQFDMGGFAGPPGRFGSGAGAGPFGSTPYIGGPGDPNAGRMGDKFGPGSTIAPWVNDPNGANIMPVPIDRGQVNPPFNPLAPVDPGFNMNRGMDPARRRALLYSIFGHGIGGGSMGGAMGGAFGGLFGKR